ASLNPFSPEPRYAEGVIALREGRDAVAARAFHKALTLDRNWYPFLELALLDARAGRFGAATSEIRAARALDPLDPLVLDAARLIHRRRRIDPVAFNSQ